MQLQDHELYALVGSGSSFNGLYCLLLLMLSTFMLDFPWSVSCVVELACLSKVSNSALIGMVFLLVVSFAAWMISIVRIQANRQLNKRSTKAEISVTYLSLILLCIVESLFCLFSLIFCLYFIVEVMIFKRSHLCQ